MAMFSWVLSISEDGDPTTCLMNMLPLHNHSHCYFLFRMSGQNFSLCDHCPLSFCYEEWGSLLLITTHQDSWTQQLEIFLLQSEQTPLPWPLCTGSAPAPGPLWWPSAELTSIQHPAPEMAFQVLCREKKNFSFSLLATLLVIQPSMLLAFTAARAHC